VKARQNTPVMATVAETNGSASYTIAEKTSGSRQEASPTRHEEYQYLDLIQYILENGEHRPDRYICILLKLDTVFRTNS
jgi:hypothetical protein